MSPAISFFTPCQTAQVARQVVYQEQWDDGHPWESVSILHKLTPWSHQPYPQPDCPTGQCCSLNFTWDAAFSEISGSLKAPLSLVFALSAPQAFVSHSCSLLKQPDPSIILVLTHFPFKAKFLETDALYPHLLNHTKTNMVSISVSHLPKVTYALLKGQQRSQIWISCLISLYSLMQKLEGTVVYWSLSPLCRPPTTQPCPLLPMKSLEALGCTLGSLLQWGSLHLF